MKRYFISTFILSMSYFANCQNTDDASKINEARYAYDVNHDCVMANKILDEVSPTSKNDPFFVFYKYKIFNGETYQCNEMFYVDSAIFYLTKYSQYFPSNLEFQKKLIELRVKKRNIEEFLFDKPRYYRVKKAGDGQPLRFYVYDSLEIIKTGNSFEIKIIIRPGLSMFYTNLHNYDYTIENIKEIPVKAYFTILPTSPVVLVNSNERDREISIKGKIRLDSIKSRAFNLTKRIKTKKNYEYINYNGVYCKETSSSFINEIEELNDLILTFKTYGGDKHLFIREEPFSKRGFENKNFNLLLKWDCIDDENINCCYNLKILFGFHYFDSNYIGDFISK